jgi:hypothetical protein
VCFMDEWFDLVLSRLDKLKPSGKDRWMACCPVHDDNTPSMVVSILNRKLVCHCFSCGANGVSVVESLGLKIGDLFQDDKEFVPDANFLLSKTQLADDTFIVIYQSAKARNERIRYKDYKEYIAAMARRERRSEKGLPQVIIPVQGFEDIL